MAFVIFCVFLTLLICYVIKNNNISF